MTEDQGSYRERNKDKVCERDILRKYHECTVMKVTVQSWKLHKTKYRANIKPAFEQGTLFNFSIDASLFSTFVSNTFIGISWESTPKKSQ